MPPHPLSTVSQALSRRISGFPMIAMKPVGPVPTRSPCSRGRVAADGQISPTRSLPVTNHLACTLPFSQMLREPALHCWGALVYTLEQIRCPIINMTRAARLCIQLKVLHHLDSRTQVPTQTVIGILDCGCIQQHSAKPSTLQAKSLPPS